MRRQVRQVVRVVRKTRDYRALPSFANFSSGIGDAAARGRVWVARGMGGSGKMYQATLMDVWWVRSLDGIRLWDITW